MADYSAQITALIAAIAAGTTRVSYGDKSVEYRSLDEMKRTLTFLQELQNGSPKPRAGFARFGRGDR